MLSFARATVADAPELCAVMTEAFDDDARRFFGIPSGGPPRYKELQYHRELAEARAYQERHDYFKVLWKGQIIGSMVVFPGDDNTCELGRICILPSHQNLGLGARCLQFLDQEYPEVRVWTLDTPSVCTRNHHFYERHGYVKIGERERGDGEYSWKYRRTRA